MWRFRRLNTRLSSLPGVVAAGALVVQGCAWKSDLDAATSQVAAQTAQIEALTTELNTLRGQHDVLTQEKAKVDATLSSYFTEYKGCLPVSERSGAKDSSGRFTAQYLGEDPINGHKYSVYDGLAFFAKYQCSVGDCSTVYRGKDPSSAEHEAIQNAWRQVVAGKR
jgi:outer membrane murein-binding lipoprotein Lpp